MSDGDGPLVDYERPGDPRSGLTSEYHCLLVTTDGTPVPTVARPTMEWRNDPEELRDDDDDDDDDEHLIYTAPEKRGSIHLTVTLSNLDRFQ